MIFSSPQPKQISAMPKEKVLVHPLKGHLKPLSLSRENCVRPSSRSDMANDTRSSRKIKDDDSNITKGRHISGKEASSKKEMTPSPSSTRKSKRLEKRMPTTPPVKRKSERVEKQRMPSPLRRSERGKKQHSSSSSEIKRTDRSSGSSDTKRKKEKREKSVRQLTLESRKVSKNERQDPRPVQVKRKRMDARSYRALIVQQTKKANATDPAEAMKRPDKLPQCESTSSGGSGSKQVEGGCPESRERSGEDLREEYQAVERSLEGSSSSLRNSEKKTVENYGEVELSNSNRKEACDSADGDGLQVSRSGDNPLPSPHVDLGKEITDDAQRVERGCSETEKLQTPELVDTEREEGEYSDIEKLQTPELVDAEREEGGCSEIEKLQTPELVDAEREEGECSEIEKLQTPELSTSKERSLGDIDLGGGDKVLPLKRKRNAVNMESDVSLMGSSKYICTSVADFISLSPPVCKRNHSHATCVTCLKRQRVAYDSMKMELCSCNPKLNQELCDTVTPKDRGEVQAIVTTGLAEKSNHDTQRKELPVDIQMDGDQNTCVICKLGGKILCCDGRGCKRSYHLSCLDPPLEDVPPGIWHCIWCVKKKIESGVHSVSEGIESIWDAREVEVTNVDGLQRQKQYLVKYKSLAHVHNQWVPESQLLLEAPLLVAKFNRKTQVTRWNPEWTMPHRLLKKRLLMPPRQHDEYHCRQAGDILVCHYEWLVKWRGLDYEHATWELENASFLNAREAQSLMTDYENRCKKAKSSKADKEMRKGPLIKLSKLPVGGSPGADINYLNSVNKLREYWHKGRNAVVFDDQERIMKVILFILSLQSNVCYPFLIISASSAISSWEAEFSRLAASVNVIVYNGNRDMRRSIRTLEFYSEGGCIMFQVLLSPPEAIVEDFEVLKCLRWEAIIVDDCQHSKISTHFEQIKMMAADLRLLFVNGQMKDTTVEYTNLLSLLETGCDANSSGGFRTSSGDNVGKLKERLSRHIAYECKSDSSKFVEYWVPVWISNLQLEQYCATILSNYLSLRSCSKNDIVGALREVLISTRKCCDHPYLVDPDLQKLIIKDLQLQDVEYLDVGIKASGKLQLLDKMLLEIKNRGLRVIIPFSVDRWFGKGFNWRYFG
ncbi:hypothetical protein L1049_014178 [Liquidambar formosana]|uniref:Uncharacterized protein n=1 Tax=Liquidambar formosana TaxID=63359 RepID=A0AAP0RRI5_LIQFO